VRALAGLTLLAIACGRERAAPPPPAPPLDLIAADTDLPQCDHYIRVVDALIACEQLPHAGRLTLARNTALMHDQLLVAHVPSATDADRARVDATCGGALPALERSARTSGCAIDP
jgi:hypothetical protein